MRAARYRLRLRLITASAAVSLLVAAMAVTGLIAVLDHEFDREIDARLVDRADALAATITISNGAVDVVGADEALFDTPNWVFDATGRRVEGAAVPTALRAPVRQLAMVRRPSELTSGAWELRAIPVGAHGTATAVAVTAVDHRPYDASLLATGRGAAILGLLAVAGATTLAAIVLARGLGPIVAMTDQAARWSRSRSDRRFGLGPARDEVTGLAHVLDDLLDRVDDALEAERRLTAEVAHELRTPLTTLQGEAELGLLAPAEPAAIRARFERIRRASASMAAAVAALLAAEQVRSTRRGGAARIRDAVDAITSSLGADIAVRVVGDTAATAAVAPDHLERILAPVIQNAVAAATSTVQVSLRTRDGVTVTVTDDGPGFDPDLVPAAFDPGVTSKHDGTGLGLGLARRLARSVGGDVDVVTARPATVRITLPSAAADHVR